MWGLGGRDQREGQREKRKVRCWLMVVVVVVVGDHGGIDVVGCVGNPAPSYLMGLDFATHILMATHEQNTLDYAHH
jgi:hypothetical protein